MYVSEEVLHKLTKCTEWRELRLLVTAAPRTSVLRRAKDEQQTKTESSY